MSKTYEVKVAGRGIGANHPPFVIAEMSGNHNQSLDRALQIVDAAAEAGAHALKLQTYTADTMTLDLKEGEFFIDDPNSLWHGRSLYELYKLAHTPWEWHEPIMQRAAEHRMIAFSTPFDETAVDFLETLDVPCYKIASFENADLELIRKVARTGKPVFISTGMASLVEIKDATEAAREAGCEELVLLRCTSSYPASPNDFHLRTIPHMRDTFGCAIGLSDHSPGIGAALAAVAVGAVAIEKHFTLRRSDGGVDSEFSLEPEEMALLVSESSRAWQSLGGINYEPSEAEMSSRVFRRSLYIVEDLAEGDRLTRDNVRAIRPGFGLSPKHLDEVLGLRVIKAARKGTPLDWDLLR